MKFTNVVLLLAGSAAAQTSSNTPGVPDVAVIKISWSRVERNPKLDEVPRDINPEIGLRQIVNAVRITANDRQPLLSIPTIDAPPPPVRHWTGYVYEFMVKNTGAKTIRKMVWEYAFTDPKTQRKVGRRQYKSKVKIRPGMTAKLVVRSSLPPIGTINATQVGKNPQDESPEQMVIQRIEYEDGSGWTCTSN